MATPWFEGYAIDACGKLLPPIKTTKDPYGITTQGDGVIYINPTVKSAAGTNATLGKFASAVGMTAQRQRAGSSGRAPLPDRRTRARANRATSTWMTWAFAGRAPAGRVLQNKKGSSRAGREDTCNPDCDSGVRLENDQLVTIAFLPAPPKHKTPNILQPPAAVIAKVTQPGQQRWGDHHDGPADAADTTSTTTAKTAPRSTTAKTAPPRPRRWPAPARAPPKRRARPRPPWRRPPRRW